ncbi:PaaX family transcriptional regulator C-terminal domain-containing protein [Dactylosporangium sp. NPDC000244]|uniref:PaaX family transcriptional regulator C-terminal domain-containing protein n=1 Tax=Dactylosporangium sp. NPDC000244 TaxID=3154365 RepID=UPI0033254EEA
MGTRTSPEVAPVPPPRTPSARRFSLPQQERARRRELRNRLRWLGYAPLYDGLWISPHALTDLVSVQLDEVAPEAITVFRARHAEFGAATRRDPLQAWDTAAIAAHYDTFTRRWRPLLHRFSVLDPRLPVRLLPPDWPRPAARDVFTTVYDGLARTAEEHVRAVATRHADGSMPAVSAHTVAEILAGVRAS